MKTYNFKIVVEPDEDADGNPAWYAYCPALESVGAATSGRTPEEALNRINEVVRMIVQEFVEYGKPLPEGPLDSVEVRMFPRSLPASRSPCSRGAEKVV
jgi:predicted RNase H-like HicB family nuclease